MCFFFLQVTIGLQLLFIVVPLSCCGNQSIYLYQLLRLRTTFSLLIDTGCRPAMQSKQIKCMFCLKK